MVTSVPMHSSISYTMGIYGVVAMAEIYLTKLLVVRRQLCAAIRMFFADEDELAIHTVASAAYRIICDLKSQRGRDEVGDYYLTSVFYVVQEYHRGTLPSTFADNPETMKWIREKAEQLPITASSRFEDIKASVSPDVAKDYWVKRNKVSNFLKHADRDASAYISTDQVDNLFLLMQALASYLDLASDDIGPEGFVLMIYNDVDSGMIEGLPMEYQKIVTSLKHLKRNERLEFCSEFLNKLKEA